jgi:hypothetical protein
METVQEAKARLTKQATEALGRMRAAHEQLKVETDPCARFRLKIEVQRAVDEWGRCAHQHFEVSIHGVSRPFVCYRETSR